MLKEFVFSVKKYYFKCIEKIKERFNILFILDKNSFNKERIYSIQT